VEACDELLELCDELLSLELLSLELLSLELLSLELLSLELLYAASREPSTKSRCRKGTRGAAATDVTRGRRPSGDLGGGSPSS
jgi:hypothetical protein